MQNDPTINTWHEAEEVLEELEAEEVAFPTTWDEVDKACEDALAVVESRRNFLEKGLRC